MTLQTAIRELFNQKELHGPDTELVNEKGESIDFHPQQCPASGKMVIVAY
jgi:hypothetical protein